MVSSSVNGQRPLFFFSDDDNQNAAARRHKRDASLFESGRWLPSFVRGFRYRKAREKEGARALEEWRRIHRTRKKKKKKEKKKERRRRRRRDFNIAPVRQPGDEHLVDQVVDDALKKGHGRWEARRKRRRRRRCTAALFSESFFSREVTNEGGSNNFTPHHQTPLYPFTTFSSSAFSLLFNLPISSNG